MCGLKHLLSWHYITASRQIITQARKHLMSDIIKVHMLVVVAAASEICLASVSALELGFFTVS